MSTVRLFHLLWKKSIMPRRLLAADEVREPYITQVLGRFRHFSQKRLVAKIRNGLSHSQKE